ncbi:hypothetical protein [Glutamicibacter sp. AOP5-A2-18]|uniref:hypothetical protein n=1 Tax=Glutamicibacter sp. AOP5-A2-18 TaxID=3457656 RepID=UPI004033D198
MNGMQLYRMRFTYKVTWVDRAGNDQNTEIVVTASNNTEGKAEALLVAEKALRVEARLVDGAYFTVRELISIKAFND